jgi:hypothetical protein
MSEKAARQPMTNGEREILFQMQKLQAKWIDLVHMCLHREANYRQRIEELSNSVQELTQEVQELHRQLAKDRLF